MHTILGANGQIAIELAKELHRNYSKEIKLVSRNPKKVNDSDELFSADLLDPIASEKAICGSEIVYFTVGLPMDSRLWEKEFELILANVINACKKYACKLVYFDNTYMYPKTSVPQDEQTPFILKGRKSKVRAQMANRVLKEIQDQTLEAVICRAPEFYGPGKTQSITNTLIFDKIKTGKTPKIPLKDHTKRTLIWTPDASKAMALIANTPNTYGQTWHLPCDDERLTYQELMNVSSKIKHQHLRYAIIHQWQFNLGSLFNQQIRELLELLPRYKFDNIFNSDKFKKTFPDFKITSYQDGISQLTTLNKSK